MNVSLNVDAKNKKTENKPSLLKKYLKIGLGVILVVGILVGSFFAYKAFEFSNNIGIKIEPKDLISGIKKDPELKKDSTGKYTTAMLVGIDSRSPKSDLKNTDSIMLATYHYDTGNITLISVPRDLFVKLPNEGWYQKINAFYSHGESLKAGNGMNYLKDTLQKITGVEIQYYALVDLQGFKKMIDAVGGVTVNVENTFTDYQYPVEQKGKPIYEVVTFKKGPQKMNGETALKFSRSRHSPDAGEGTDFARARRQQKVISALKDKVLTSDTLLNPQKILEIMSAVQENVKLSEITNEDIQAGINIAKSQKESTGKVYSFVLEPSFGNSQILTSKVAITNAYAIAPVAGIDNYTQVKEIVKLCFAKPEIYSQKLKIRTYDTGIGNAQAAAETKSLQKKYPYVNIVYMGTLLKGKTGTVVYPSNSSKSAIAQEFAAFFKSTNVTKPSYITTSLNGEDITILFGAKELE